QDARVHDEPRGGGELAPRGGDDREHAEEQIPERERRRQDDDAALQRDVRQQPAPLGGTGRAGDPQSRSHVRSGKRGGGQSRRSGPARRRKLSRYRAVAASTTSSGSSGAGDVLFQPGSVSSQSRIGCLSSDGWPRPGA